MSQRRNISGRSIIMALAMVLIAQIPVAVDAVPASLKQQILPLECVFEYVNDGTGTIVYLTPDECGVIIPPDPEPEPDPGPEPDPDIPNPDPGVTDPPVEMPEFRIPFGNSIQVIASIIIPTIVSVITLNIDGESIGPPSIIPGLTSNYGSFSLESNREYTLRVYNEAILPAIGIVLGPVFAVTFGILAAILGLSVLVFVFI